MQEKSHPKQHKKSSALQLLNQKRMSIILQIRALFTNVLHVQTSRKIYLGLTEVNFKKDAIIAMSNHSNTKVLLIA